MERQLPPIRREFPPPRGIRLWRERAVVAGECHQQRVTLDLPRQWMDRDQWVRRLEVGARGVNEDVGRTSGRSTSDRQDEKQIPRAAWPEERSDERPRDD